LQELLNEETRRCKDLRVALDAKQRAIDRTAHFGGTTALSRSAATQQRLGGTRISAADVPTRR
jgi:hypothetical protein